MLSNSGSYDHRVRLLGDGGFSISWYVDYNYGSDRLRYPRRSIRWTDAMGARRFAKKWHLEQELDEEIKKYNEAHPGSPLEVTGKYKGDPQNPA